MAVSFSHFSLSDRIAIQDGLLKRRSFKDIALELGKHPSSVSLEVRKRFIKFKTGGSGLCFNDCALRFGCKITSLCNNGNPCFKRYCHFCTHCAEVCKDYRHEACHLLSKPPYVCNGCKHYKNCTLEKSVYKADAADKAYSTLLHESRSGIAVGEDDIARLNSVVSPLIKNGQSVYHITENNRDVLMCSQRTIYNYVNYGLFDAINLDLPRKVRYKPRLSCAQHFKVDAKCRIGRSYDDFLSYMTANPDTPIVEIDTVEGTKGGKVLLTVHFTESLLLLAFLRDSNTSASVTAVFDRLYDILGTDVFMELFPLILTDNGSEFSNPSAIEFGCDGNRRTKLFYCESSSPYQKGAVENNHELLRRVLPKGHSFEPLTPEDVLLILNHINSYSRKKLNGKSSYEQFSFLHGNEIAAKLGLRAIPANSVVLTPALLIRG